MKFKLPTIRREHGDFNYGPYSTILCSGFCRDKSQLGVTTADSREGFLQNSSDLAHTIRGQGHGLRLEVVKNFVLPHPRGGRVIIQLPRGEGWKAVERVAKRLPPYKAIQT